MPLVPHALSAVPDRHVEPEQQPVGQVIALHPVQVPDPVHVSPAGQAWQAMPVVPQSLVLVPGRQAPPEQHPVGQVVTSQATQVPPAQLRPAQGGPVPHAHIPAAVQLSASTGSQAMQAVPPVPQVVADGVVQVGPEQQPLGQKVASQPLHVPAPVHDWPAGHG